MIVIKAANRRVGMFAAPLGLEGKVKVILNSISRRTSLVQGGGHSIADRKGSEVANLYGLDVANISLVACQPWSSN
jgi:hypothetical protein